MSWMMPRRIFLIKVLQLVEETQRLALVEGHRYGDVVTADGLLTRSLRARFGRKMIRRTPFIYDQMFKDLNMDDRALWDERRYFVKVFGFSSLFSLSGKVFIGEWHTLTDRPRFCPVIVSKRMMGGCLKFEFSLLTALSKSEPFARPLCIDGDPREWLIVPAGKALAQLFKWQAGAPDLVFPTEAHVEV
ncbi:hypothetical protein J7411_16295 [Xanthomonas phaseoli pv. dieffenbachiae]|uniref:hypothetical protein n=1 Tax=Xanthomonas citri TaxID=346 RepID=UPI00111C7347|nr:hypothetical protein [Xanthomonas citri]MBO9752871.1 hypothetical protein [Xanthomonas phaseoli pv. dieffenbachiae]